MHTAEDTFNTLRRIPFDMVRQTLITIAIGTNVKTFLESNGWTEKEYSDMWHHKYNNGVLLVGRTR